MSIINQRFSSLGLIIAEVLLLAIVSAAQNIEAIIKISPPATVKIEGKLIKQNSNRASRNWSFRQSIAGIENLGARISELALSNGQNRRISFKRLADGEYLADEEADGFVYQADLKSSPTIAAMAHASRLSGEQGLLMLGDLLPQIATNNQTISARIKFDLPADWKIISREKSTGENAFYVENIEKAVFSVGKQWREEKVQIGKTLLKLAVSSEWQFSDAEAAKMAGEIYGEYQKLFGEPPTDIAQIFLMRAPPEVKFGRWSAETRGANTTIISGDMPFKTQSWQLLHEQLRHELFHLWMPNSLALTGNYDWFYEGFTAYQALRTGIATNQIRFEDFLDTLAQAYNLDNQRDGKVSLIDSSKNRWSVANNGVYARGLLTAFLCDVALLRASRGNRSVSEIFQEVYKKHRIPNEPKEGNAAILEILKVYSELDPIIEGYVAGVEKINWKNDLEAIGIETTADGFNVRLSVRVKLNGRQKNLLNKLGYNNWRKISGKRK